LPGTGRTSSRLLKANRPEAATPLGPYLPCISGTILRPAANGVYGPFGRPKKRPETKPSRLWICCDPSAVAMRFVAWLASVKLAFLSWLGTTGWTRDSENLFWAEFCFHDRGTIPQTGDGRRPASAQRVATMIPGRVWTLADLGERRPRHTLEHNDRDCDCSQFDSLVHRLNTDYLKTMNADLFV
jgi:hypothetical protein